MSELESRGMSAIGFVAMMGIAWLFSRARDQVPWRTVLWGSGLQLAIGILLLRSEIGRGFFVATNALVTNFLDYANLGARFVFGPLLDSGFSIALNALPVIVFMGSLFSVLYHLGIIQRIVAFLAWGLSRSMKLTGAESLVAVTNIFCSMTESTLVVKPYLPRMTQSELFSLMTLGMATVAGSVLLVYVQILGGGEIAGHLVTASLLSAPAGLVIAKLMHPEQEVPETIDANADSLKGDAVNVIDAAATGAINGLRLALEVGALLLAFYAIIAMLNDMLSVAGGLVGFPDLTFQSMLGFALAPVAFLMGVPWEDAGTIGGLLGIKTILNEFIAYEQLASAATAGELQPRSVLIASYALCGFANFGSLAILLGGVGGIAPERRHDVARLGLRSILAGSLTTFMTACLAGMLL